MEIDKHITDMVFRIYTSKEGRGETIAVFPAETDDSEGRTLMAYSDLDGHVCVAWSHILTATRPATPAEYGDLLATVERLGYLPKVVRKRTVKHMHAIRAQVDEWRAETARADAKRAAGRASGIELDIFGEPLPEPAPEPCDECGESVVEGGDGYDGMCGNCADKSSDDASNS